MSNAEALYGPDSDQGLRFGGLTPSLTEAAFSEGARVTLEQLTFGDAVPTLEDRVEVSQAFIDMGLGPTNSDAMLAAFAAEYHATEGRGYTDAEIETRSAAGLAVLQRDWGAEFPEKMERAMAVYERGVKGRPDLELAAEVFGFTSSPDFFKLLEARERRAPK